MGQVCTACFFGLKVETAGKALLRFFTPSTDGPGGLVELLPVKTLNTEPSEASCACGGRGSQGWGFGGAYPFPLVPFQSISQGKHTPSLSLQQQQW